MSARFVLGLGTGRCGTNSLARLIALQPSAVSTHERRGSRVAWVGGEPEVDAVIDAMLAEPAAPGALVSEVGFYYLPYLERFRARLPGLRVVVLQRERAATIASFIERTRDKANYWAPPKLTQRRRRWQRCFPKYDAGLPKPEAIGRYYDEYYATTAALERAEPGFLLTVRTEDLPEAATQQRILDFLGVPRASQRVQPGLLLNRAADKPFMFLRRLRYRIESWFRAGMTP